MEAKRKSEGDDTGLESLRVEIDDCDWQIIELLAQRFELVKRIGRYKAMRNLPVLDAGREAELLSDREGKASGAGNYSIGDIFKLILEESRRIQAKVKEDLDAGG